MRGLRIAGSARIAPTRWAGLLATWVVISDGNAADLPAGVIVAALATWVSLLLHGPGALRVDVGALLRLTAHLLAQSVVAGIDVAKRAFDPALPLYPGVIRYRSKLPRGSAQAAFSTIVSMVPGTVPLGPAPDGVLLVHCLDTEQPVTMGLARDEELCLATVRSLPSDV